MPIYEYICPQCGTKQEINKSFLHSQDEEQCESCGVVMDRIYSVFGICGTRDTFGVGKGFYHTNADGTQKEITTWKEWERAGYREWEGKSKDKRKIKYENKVAEKIEKIKHKKKKKFSVKVK